MKYSFSDLKFRRSDLFVENDAIFMKAPAERPVLNFTGRCSAALRTIKPIFYTQVAALQLSITCLPLKSDRL